jgi:hypothetical protein
VQYDRGKLAHCDEAFETEDELFEHKQQCHFRPMQCPNDGCQAGRHVPGARAEQRQQQRGRLSGCYRLVFEPSTNKKSQSL